MAAINPGKTEDGIMALFVIADVPHEVISYLLDQEDCGFILLAGHPIRKIDSEGTSLPLLKDWVSPFIGWEPEQCHEWLLRQCENPGDKSPVSELNSELEYVTLSERDCEPKPEYAYGMQDDEENEVLDDNVDYEGLYKGNPYLEGIVVRRRIITVDESLEEDGTLGYHWHISYDECNYFNHDRNDGENEDRYLEPGLQCVALPAETLWEARIDEWRLPEFFIEPVPESEFEGDWGPEWFKTAQEEGKLLEEELEWEIIEKKVRNKTLGEAKVAVGRVT